MPDINTNELAFNRLWWWDPGPDGPYGPHVPWEVQQRIAAVVLNARAATLKIQADTYTQIAGLVAGAKSEVGR
jgi:hypothetical protein